MIKGNELDIENIDLLAKRGDKFLCVTLFWTSKNCSYLCNQTSNSPVSFSACHQRPARERHKIRIASQENVDNQAPRNIILQISTFQFTFKCGYDFIFKYTGINSLHVTQIDLLHNDTFCST